jgi:hypothetical protein
MSIARDLFNEFGPVRFSRRDEAYEKLTHAADLWRDDGQYFSAGVSMLDASTLLGAIPSGSWSLRKPDCQISNGL